MTTFRYQARNIDGDTVTGTLDAHSERLALRDLRRRGLTAVALAGVAENPTSRLVRARQPRASDRILLLRQIALLLEAGVVLDEILRSMADSPAFRPLRSALQDLRRDVRQGTPFAPALRRALPQLPAHAFQLVEAGELTGRLRQTIADAAQQMDEQQRLARDIRSALVYPAILVFSGIAAVLFVFTFVVPRFAVIFKNRMESLPWLSRTVMNAGSFFNEHMLMVGASLGLSILAVHQLSQIPAARGLCYEAVLRMPIIGDWLSETEMGRWTGMLATLLANKIPLVQSMTLARGAVHSERLKGSLSQVERAVRSGSALAKALGDYTTFDATTINLVGVGERAGNLAGMLRSAANLCEENTRDRLKRLIMLIEPAAIVMIGSVVGTIVVAVFLAVSSISNIPL